MENQTATPTDPREVDAQPITDLTEYAEEPAPPAPVAGDLPSTLLAGLSVRLRPRDLSVAEIEEETERFTAQLQANESMLRLGLSKVPSDKIILFGSDRTGYTPYFDGSICASIAAKCRIIWDFLKRNPQTGQPLYRIEEIDTGAGYIYTVEVDLACVCMGVIYTATGRADTEKSAASETYVDAMAAVLGIPRKKWTGNSLQNNPAFEPALEKANKEQIRAGKRLALNRVVKSHAVQNGLSHLITSALGLRNVSIPTLQRYMPHFNPQKAKGVRYNAKHESLKPLEGSTADGNPPADVAPKETALNKGQNEFLDAYKAASVPNDTVREWLAEIGVGRLSELKAAQAKALVKKAREWMEKEPLDSPKAPEPPPGPAPILKEPPPADAKPEPDEEPKGDGLAAEDMFE